MADTIDEKESTKSELVEEKDSPTTMDPIEKEATTLTTTEATSVSDSGNDGANDSFTANDGASDSYTANDGASDSYNANDGANDSYTANDGANDSYTANDDSEYDTCDEEKQKQQPSKLRSKDSDESDQEDEEEGEGGSIGSRRRFSISSIDDNLSDDVIIEDERLEGDGQEQEEVGVKKLDDDEDRRNPQYIPKKGTFYEHDDRTCVESEVTATESGVDSQSNDTANRSKNLDSGRSNRSKQVWTDKAGGDKWHHDLYVEDEQVPKSARELIDTYGYDIRNEEAPPKARRRRKYGRGPKAYTRKWDDEPAYKANANVTSSGNRQSKSRNSYRRSFVENNAEFPTLPNSKSDASQSRARARDQQQDPEPPVNSKGEERHPPASHADSPNTKSILKTSNVRDKSVPKQPTRTRPPVQTEQPAQARFTQNRPVDSPRQPRGRGQFKPGPGMVPKLEFTPSRGRGRTIPAYSEMTVRSGPDIGPPSHKFVENVIKNISKMEISAPPSGSVQPNSNPVNTNEEKGVRESATTNRSKRYSAQRQRSLPETTFSPPAPPVAAPPAPAAPYYPPTQPPPHILGVPDYPPPPPPMPQPQAMPPPQQPQPPQMMAFAAPPPPFLAAAPYPHPLPPPAVIRPPPPPMQPIPPPMPQEVYQGQNGTVYYSAQSQAAIPRQTPSRRKKVAIPIVPPPDT